MKKILLSALLLLSLATISSAKQTTNDLVSLITDWCLTDTHYNFDDGGWTQISNYKECGGSATMITFERHNWE